jgi:site-specific DNA-methyltransferase (adenine-specific)
VLVFFGGIGPPGAAALLEERRFVLIDSHAAAIDVMRKRFASEARVVFNRTSQAQVS